MPACLLGKELEMGANLALNRPVISLQIALQKKRTLAHTAKKKSVQQVSCIGQLDELLLIAGKVLRWAFGASCQFCSEATMHPI